MAAALKGKEAKYEFHFRNNGKKVAFDVISKEGKIVQPLLDLGIDLAEYHNFRFDLKTGADLRKIYDQGQNPSDELLSEILNLLIYVKSSGENIKYLSNALYTAFKDVKIEETDFSYTPNRTIKCPACGKETVAEMRTKDEYSTNYIERLKMPNVALNSCCCNDSK